MIRSVRRIIGFAFVLLVAAAVALTALGAMSVRNDASEVTVTIDKVKVRETTKEVIDKGKQVGSAVIDRANRAVDNMSDAPPGHD
jgi:hypothetical protein